MEVDVVIDVGGKVNLVLIGVNGVFFVFGVNVGYGVGFNVVGYVFVGFCNNGMGYILLELEFKNWVDFYKLL